MNRRPSDTAPPAPALPAEASRQDYLPEMHGHYCVLLHHLTRDDFLRFPEHRDGHIPEQRVDDYLAALTARLDDPDGNYRELMQNIEQLTTDAYKGVWRLYAEHERLGAEALEAHSPRRALTRFRELLTTPGYYEAELTAAVQQRAGEPIRQYLTMRWKLGRGLLVDTHPGEQSAAPIQQLARRYAKRRHADPLLEQLLTAGIPEAALASNDELWALLRNPAQLPVESANTVFRVRDEHGNQYLMKLHRNHVRALREARATFHLGELPCIVGTPFRDPFSSPTFAVTLQNWVPLQEPPSLDQLLAHLAQFHREAPTLLAPAGLALGQAHLRDAQDYLSRWQLLRRKLGFTPDKQRLAENIAQLREHATTVIHNDLIPDNLRGPFLLDLENIGYGAATIDLALLFLSHDLPRAQWPRAVDRYARYAGREATPLLTLLEPAAYVVATREAVNAPLYKPSSTFAKRLWRFLRGEH